jgi:two-component system, NtrC family, C4-dicarboxylate transport sensor histidine kinase DctB
MAEKSTPDTALTGGMTPPGLWRIRVIVAALVIVAVTVVGITNRWLTDRFTETLI